MLNFYLLLKFWLKALCLISKPIVIYSQMKNQLCL